MAFLKSGIMMCNLLRYGGLSLVRSSRGLADKSVVSEKIASMSAQELLKNTVRTSGFNKLILVWTGRYKNVAEVPESVSYEAMQKARNKIRIKLANYMMAATVVACIVMVIAGKKAADAGETITKMNLDWHKEYNDQAKAEIEAKKNKT